VGAKLDLASLIKQQARDDAGRANRPSREVLVCDIEAANPGLTYSGTWLDSRVDPRSANPADAVELDDVRPVLARAVANEPGGGRPPVRVHSSREMASPVRHAATTPAPAGPV
jgi:hypothetical protein